MLLALGFNREQIEEANEYVCGTMTIEGAPHLKKNIIPFLTAPINAVKASVIFHILAICE